MAPETLVATSRRRRELENSLRRVSPRQGRMSSRLALVSIFAKGHLLMKAFRESERLRSARRSPAPLIAASSAFQFTSDMPASDVLGISI